MRVKATSAGPGAGAIAWRCCLLAALLACAHVAGAVTFSNAYRSPRNPERKKRAATTLIVLHTTEAPAKSSLNKLSDRGEAHYCVVENGTVYRIVDRDREAFHAGRSMWNGKENVDSFSIGIEVVGYHDKPVTLAQLDALRELLAMLKKIYRIDDEHVVCHSHVAYGAPNRWHKRRHRGRKQCGMLFAMPSVRAKLGLKSRPAFDPDIRARRLVQADSYLNGVLYGKTDTMVKKFGKGAAPAAASADGATPLEKFENWFKTIGARDGAAPRAEPGAAPAPAREAPRMVGSTPGYRTLGYDGKTLYEIAGAASGSPDLVVLTPDGKYVRGSELKGGDAEKLPKGTRVFVGYRVGGPVTSKNGPVKICGSAWRKPSTYYLSGGRLTPGDEVDDRKIFAGTVIFYPK